MRIFTTIVAIATSFTLCSQDYQLNGNLGIGTNPENKLDVSGDSKLNGNLTVTENASFQGTTKIDGTFKLLNLSETESGYILFVDSDDTVNKMTPQNAAQLFDHLALCEPNGNSIWRHGTGLIHTCPAETNVGIGTDSPIYKLDVAGDAHINTKLAVGNPSTILSEFVLGINAEDNFGIGINQNTTSLKSALTITNNSNNVFQIYSNGVMSSQLSDGAWNAVEIKNAEGQDIFRINPTGEVLCSAIKVRMVPFPDYVFDDNYKLMSLEDLKIFIQENKRLPNMPSAESIDKNGGDLGEINRLLIEKTEEQALYILEHEAEIEDLQNQITELLNIIQKMQVSK